MCCAYLQALSVRFFDIVIACEHPTLAELNAHMASTIRVDGSDPILFEFGEVFACLGVVCDLSRKFYKTIESALVVLRRSPLSLSDSTVDRSRHPQ
jgi:hypothetical protein